MQQRRKTTVAALLAGLLLLPLAACQVQPVEASRVPTDAERVVQIGISSAGETAKPAPEGVTKAMPTVQELEADYAEERYTFSTTAAEGRLTVTADATVRYPASLQLPLARVSAVYYTQELASKYFDFFFAGEQPVVIENGGAATRTKQSLRDTIAYYEQAIADGTVERQTMLTPDEARVYIQELEALIPSAPEVAPPDEVSDGTLKPGIWWNNEEQEALLELNIKSSEKRMHLYTPVRKDEHAESHFFYDYKDYERFYEPVSTELAPNTSIPGMATTWDEAVALCREVFALSGATDMAVSEAFRLEKNGNLAYSFRFTRTVEGSPVAWNRESTRYPGVDTPWGYEGITATVSDDGICNLYWYKPTEVTEVINPFANAISFADAAKIFETMVIEAYEPETVRYDGVKRPVGVRVDSVLLSLLRIRDTSTLERKGLYVPAWVFYGDKTINGNPEGNWTPRIVFAINALDGSVIDMEMGY